MKKTACFFLFLFIFPLSLYPLNPAEYLKKADEYNKIKDYLNAEKYYLLAEEANPKSGFHSARLGQFYHFSLKDYPRAIQAFERAYQKKMTESWLFIQAGNSYRYLNDPENSEKWFQLGISTLNSVIDDNKKKNKSITRFLDNLQMIYAQYLASLMDFKEIHRAAEIGKECFQRFPESTHPSFLNYYAAVYYWLSIESFGNSQWKKAMEQIQFADQLVKRDEKLKERLSGEYQTLLKVYENREKIGKIKPLYTHKIVVVILPETNARDLTNQINIQSKVSPEEEKMTVLSIRFVKAFIESATGGKLGIEYQIEKPDIVLTRLRADLEIETDERKNKYPDLEYLCAQHEEYFKNRAQNFDTLILIWSAGEFNVANGGKRRLIFPKSGISVWKGYNHISSERIAHNGPDLMLHEFFHTIEKMAGITVNHGYYPENRKYFPDWKGENGNDYYFWQLSENIPLKRKLNYGNFHF